MTSGPRLTRTRRALDSGDGWESLNSSSWEPSSRSQRSNADRSITFANPLRHHGTAWRIGLRRTAKPAAELRDLGAVLPLVAVRHVGDQVLEVVLRSVPRENADLSSLRERDPRQHLGGALVGLGVFGERLFRALPASLLDLGVVEGLAAAHHQTERLGRFFTQDAGERVSGRQLVRREMGDHVLRRPDPADAGRLPLFRRKPLDGAKNSEMTVSEDIVGVHRSALLR